jgi:hypothetical protein
MRSVLIASLISLAGCPINPEATEPEPPPPDAPVTPGPVPTTNVFASSFDQYCSTDYDCAAVYEGNACAPTRCANAAIRYDALPKYRAELGAFWSCYEPEPQACSYAIGDVAVCVANKCTLPGL